MANQFQNDPNCKALWRFEDAWAVDGVSNDSIGGNHLIPLFAAPTRFSTDRWEGSYCCDFDDATTMGFQCQDSSQDAGFPCRYADASPVKSFSICVAIKPSQLPAEGERDELIGKYAVAVGNERRTFLLYLGTTTGVTNVKFLKGYSSGTLYEGTTADGVAIVAGQWYHIGLTYNDATGAVRIRVWDDTAGVVYDKTDTHTQSISVTNVSLSLGNRPIANTANAYDGLMDEVVVFDDILTADEIDQIRRGRYLLNWQAAFYLASSMEADMEVVTFAPLVGEWTWPVRERLKFNTEILQSHNRTEQRIAHHGGIPRQAFGTQVLARGEAEVAELEANLHGSLKLTWPVPLWPDSEAHTADLPAGSGSIAVDTRYADFRADSYIVIWQSWQFYEVIRVATVADAALTLARNTAKAFSGPKWIVPCRLGWLTGVGQLERYDGGALLDLTWEVDVSDLAAVTGFVADLTYDGLTVLSEPAWWPGDHGEAAHDPDVAVLDSGSGPFTVISNSTYNEVAQSHVWHMRTKARCWWLRQFLHSVKGRQSAFLVPTFRSDLSLSRPVGAADTSLYVANRGLTRMGLNDLRTYVAFRPPLANIIPRKVTGISAVSTSEELITIDVAPGAAFAAGSGLSWVDRCRLASDEIDLDWTDRGQLSCSTRFVRIT